MNWNGKTESNRNECVVCLWNIPNKNSLNDDFKITLKLFLSRFCNYKTGQIQKNLDWIWGEISSLNAILVSIHLMCPLIYNICHNGFEIHILSAWDALHFRGQTRQNIVFVFLPFLNTFTGHLFCFPSSFLPFFFSFVLFCYSLPSALFQVQKNGSYTHKNQWTAQHSMISTNSGTFPSKPNWWRAIYK